MSWIVLRLPDDGGIKYNGGDIHINSHAIADFRAADGGTCLHMIDGADYIVINSPEQIAAMICRSEKGERARVSRKVRALSPDVDATVTIDERTVFAFWCETMGRPHSALDEPRLNAIRAGLDIAKQLGDCPVEICKDAIYGCSKSAWHMGENDRHQKYNYLELIFKDAANIERFVAIGAKARKDAEKMKAVGAKYAPNSRLP